MRPCRPAGPGTRVHPENVSRAWGTGLRRNAHKPQDHSSRRRSHLKASAPACQWETQPFCGLINIGVCAAQAEAEAPPLSLAIEVRIQSTMMDTPVFFKVLTTHIGVQGSSRLLESLLRQSQPDGVEGGCGFDSARGNFYAELACFSSVSVGSPSILQFPTHRPKPCMLAQLETPDHPSARMIKWMVVCVLTLQQKVATWYR